MLGMEHGNSIPGKEVRPPSLQPTGKQTHFEFISG